MPFLEEAKRSIFLRTNKITVVETSESSSISLNDSSEFVFLQLSGSKYHRAGLALEKARSSVCRSPTCRAFSKSMMMSQVLVFS